MLTILSDLVVMHNVEVQFPSIWLSLLQQTGGKQLISFPLNFCCYSSSDNWIALSKFSERNEPIRRLVRWLVELNVLRMHHTMIHLFTVVV